MLKPFDTRVKATYDYLLCSVEFCNENNRKIKTTRTAHKQAIATAKSYPIDWEVDKYDLTQMQFNGYEYGYSKAK